MIKTMIQDTLFLWFKIKTNIVFSVKTTMCKLAYHDLKLNESGNIASGSKCSRCDFAEDAIIWKRK